MIWWICVCEDGAIPEGRRTAPISALRRSRTEQQLVKFGYRSKTDPVTGTEFWTAHPGIQVQSTLGLSSLPAQDLGLPGPRTIPPTVAIIVLAMR